MAEDQKKRWRFPGIGWISSRLSRKIIVLLLALAVFNCILMLLFFLSRLGTDLETLCALSPEEAEAVRQALLRNATLPFILLTAGIFLVMGTTIVLLIVAPIVRLRHTMRRYYESGQRPERTARLDEVGRLQNTFADLVGIVERKEQAERQLIASISHDIKTPLTSVMGYSERLRSADLPSEKQRQYLNSVYEKAVAIKSIVDEFDEYLDAGLRDNAPLRLMTAQTLCDLLRDEYGDELAETGAQFELRCLCPREQFLCNWDHMRRCFGNLIGNSLQHSGADPIRLTLTCRREDEDVVFLFADNGRGVPQDMLEQIFEPLYTSDKGRKVSGLGLSICRSIVRAHGGSIRAANLSPGLQIRIALPRVDI